MLFWVETQLSGSEERLTTVLNTAGDYGLKSGSTIDWENRLKTLSSSSNEWAPFGQVNLRVRFQVGRQLLSYALPNVQRALTPKTSTAAFLCGNSTLLPLRCCWLINEGMPEFWSHRNWLPSYKWNCLYTADSQFRKNAGSPSMHNHTHIAETTSWITLNRSWYDVAPALRAY